MEAGDNRREETVHHTLLSAANTGGVDAGAGTDDSAPGDRLDGPAHSQMPAAEGGDRQITPHMAYQPSSFIVQRFSPRHGKTALKCATMNLRP